MRTLAHARFIIAFLALALLGMSPATADQLVKFAAAGGASPGPEIQGYLAKPPGNGPFPAVVVLHSCLGLRADRPALARTLTGWGYVTLFVDDFSTRGLTETCAVSFPEGLADASGALAFVARLPSVDQARIAALGYSQGAATALQIATMAPAADVARPTDPEFRAVAAFYPACASLAGARLLLPTLILVGAADAVTPAAACEALARGHGGTVTLVVYPGAGHVFDDPTFAGGKSVLGMWLQYDPHAAVQSRSALRDFLAAALAH